MEDVPKIVQARLTSAPPSEHPDANLLAAFGEGSLTKREHSGVLQHLSKCPTCREIIALAMPEQQEAVAAAAVGMPLSMDLTAAASPQRRRFNLRWGALAACAVIVVGIVLVTRHPEQKSVAVLPPGTISSGASPEQQLAQLEHQQSDVRYESRRSGPAQSLEAKPLERARKPTREPASKAEGRDALKSGNMQPAIVLPPSREADEVRAPELSTLPAAPKAADSPSLVAAAPALPLEKSEQSQQTKQAIHETEATGKDKKAQAGSGFSGDIVPGTRDFNRVGLSSRWTLSEGKLRRSSDAGATWEIIPFDQDGKFRALSVMEPYLWVGGTQGVLYHSLDSGATWVRMVPTEGNEPLAEDIVRIEFSDPRHGKLITPHSQWRTSDGGISWHKK